ncbi:hypothetical protein [Streptomyces sp. NPDC059371]|uniref:hypothetical protein n=1 Tax=Streptomyces sp. NPDC059371 TaxID=3346812 RepID=UPI0036935E81
MSSHQVKTEFGSLDVSGPVGDDADRPRGRAQTGQTFEDFGSAGDVSRHEVDVVLAKLRSGHFQTKGFPQSGEVCGVGAFGQLGAQPAFGIWCEGVGPTQAGHGVAERRLPVVGVPFRSKRARRCTSASPSAVPGSLLRRPHAGRINGVSHVAGSWSKQSPTDGIHGVVRPTCRGFRARSCSDRL